MSGVCEMLEGEERGIETERIRIVARGAMAKHQGGRDETKRLVPGARLDWRSSPGAADHD